jgi:hypothetical protein
MMMQPCPDETAFQWIASGCVPLLGIEDEEVVWQGNTVANLLPQTFDAYAKILHRIDARYDWIDNPLSQGERFKSSSCHHVPKSKNSSGKHDAKSQEPEFDGEKSARFWTYRIPQVL